MSEIIRYQKRIHILILRESGNTEIVQENGIDIEDQHIIDEWQSRLEELDGHLVKSEFWFYVLMKEIRNLHTGIAWKQMQS